MTTLKENLVDDSIEVRCNLLIARQQSSSEKEEFRKSNQFGPDNMKHTVIFRSERKSHKIVSSLSNIGSLTELDFVEVSLVLLDRPC